MSKLIGNKEFDGDVYVKGVGGYDGTNPANAKTLQQDINEGLPKMTEITWSELKSLRDNSQLIPGMQYRITDYITTTTQAYTQSAGHQFDIIVTADSDHTLNENARACLHSGDTYFSEDGANLGAWELKYSLDNKYEFEWAQRKNNTYIYYSFESIWDTFTYSNSTVVVDGITYYRFDIFYCKSRRPSPGDRLYKYYNYTVPEMSYARDVLRYDADTDQIIIGYIRTEGPYEYAENFVIAENGIKYYEFVNGDRSIYCTSANPSIGDSAYTLYFTSMGIDVQTRYTNIISDVTPAGTLGDDGKGVIYYMKDEHNNICHYDFKNILFSGGQIPGLGYGKNYYTFSYMENSASTTITDFSTINVPISSSVMYSCYDNVLGTCYSNKSRRWRTTLPFIVFRAMETEKYYYNNNNLVEQVGNVIGDNCKKILISTACSYNKILDNCAQCQLDYGSMFNTIKSYSTSVHFYPGSSQNICGNSSVNIVIRGKKNVIEDECNSISVTGDTNTFDYRCRSMGINGNMNNFGKDCYKVYFTGTVNSYNNIGISANNVRFYGDCYFNTLGDKCMNIYMGTGCTGNNFAKEDIGIYMGNYCTYNCFEENCHNIYFGQDTTHWASYYSYIIVEPCVANVVLNCSATTSYSLLYTYVRLKSSVNNKTITDGNVGQTAWTVYTGTETIINV